MSSLQEHIAPDGKTSALAHARTRLWMVLCAMFLLPGSALALDGCVQASTASLSSEAAAILALNDRLAQSAPTIAATAQLAGAHQERLVATTDLLQSRAALVQALMRTHPEEVRSIRLPDAVASRLTTANPGNAVYLEQDVTVSGDLGVIAVDDFAGGVASRAYVLHSASSALQLALHPVVNVPAQTMLHRRVVVGGVQLGQDLVAETLAFSPTTAIASVSMQAAVAAPASNSTLTCSTAGQQRTAVLMLQFPGNTPAFPGSYGTAAWWQQAIAGQTKSVNSLWSEMTAGTTYASVDVYGPLTLPQRYGCSDYLAMRSAALSLASNTVDLSRYTRIVLGFPASSCTFGGLADIGCNGADSIVPHPYSVVWMPIVTSYTASTGVWASLAHELGHNLGLNHANTLDFGSVSLGPIDFQATNPGTVYGTGATAAAGDVTAVDTEYGDAFSVMGNPWSSGPGPYSAEHRARLLHWFPASGTGNGLGTITAPGSYTLQPASGGTGLRALRVLRDAASASWLWLEYRNGATPYDAANLAAVAGENASQGAVVHYENGYGDHQKTYQLDMTPAGRGNNFADGALLPGVTWSDPYSPLSLTVNSITAAGLNVSVRYDANCAAFTWNGSPIAATGGSGTVTVSAPSTCSWRASSNAAWMSLSGTTTGTGNGSFTWNASANTGVGQRVTYLSLGRTSQRLLQLGSGANVLALSPANATVVPGENVVLTLALQDSNLSDLQTVEFDALAAGVPACTVLAEFSAGTPQFFLLDPASQQFTNGLSAGSSSSLSTASCTLTGTGSGLSVSGSTLNLALNLAFPADSPGVRALYATANAGTELPVGLLNVGTVTAPETNPTTNPPTTLTPQPTSISLAGVPVSALPGTTLTLNASVSAVHGSTIPSGSVRFFDGATALGTVALNAAGVASVPTAALSIGTHAFTAVYGGDATFAGSASAAATVTVTQAASTTVLAVSATQVSAGGSATLTVSVGHATGTPEPTGTVTLRDGAVLISTLTLPNATAGLPVSGLTAGAHTFTATYSGDGNYLPSTSPAVTVTAGKFSTALSLLSASPVLAGAPVRIAVTAAGSTASAGAALPTGTVLLQEGTTSLGSVALVRGAGALTLAALPVGNHTLTAVYGGDNNFAAANTTGAALTVVDFSIAGPGTQADISVTAGATTGNTATVTVAPGSSGFPFGIALVCNGAPAGATCTVNPEAVTPGSNAVPVTVTVTTTASSTRLRAGIAGLGLLPLLGLLASTRPRRPRSCLLATALVAFLASLTLAGCGSGVSGSSGTGTTPSSPGTATGTPTGVTTLTVQAVASSGGATLTHSATVTLLVK